GLDTNSARRSPPTGCIGPGPAAAIGSMPRRRKAHWPMPCNRLHEDDTMTQPRSAGAAFRAALAAESPLQVIGAINANHALLARRAGFKAISLSGGGVAAGSLGLPDLGINTLEDVLIDVRRITDVCD